MAVTRSQKSSSAGRPTASTRTRNAPAASMPNSTPARGGHPSGQPTTRDVKPDVRSQSARSSRTSKPTSIRPKSKQRGAVQAPPRTASAPTPARTVTQTAAIARAASSPPSLVLPALPRPETAAVGDMGDAWRIWLWVWHVNKADVSIVPGVLPHTHRVTRKVDGKTEDGRTYSQSHNVHSACLHPLKLTWQTFTLLQRGLRKGPFDYLIGTNPHGAITPLQVQQATERARIAAAIFVQDIEDEDDDDEDEDDEYDEDEMSSRRGGCGRKRHWLDESDEDDDDELYDEDEGYRSSTESDQDWFEREIVGRSREEVAER